MKVAALSQALRGRGGTLSRRAVVLVLCASVIGLPAGIARVMCVGNSCDVEASAEPDPGTFCSLPDRFRDRLTRGFYEGRSGDLVAVTGATGVTGRSDSKDLWDSEVMWPSVAREPSTRVPVVFHGTGVDPGVQVPPETRVTSVAETIAELTGIARPHPDVRSGEAIADLATDVPPRLVLQVVWRGVGSEDLEREPEAWPTVQALLEEGTGTLDAQVESLPLDPTATLTTIGTGGFPSQHGVVGSVFRSNESFGKQHVELVAAGRDGFTIIATIGDHLQELNTGSLVGLAGNDIRDKALIGGEWATVGADEIVRIANGRGTDASASSAVELLEDEDFGRDATPDLLAVVLSGSSVQDLDQATDRIIRAAQLASGSSLATVVTATGTLQPPVASVLSAETVARKLERAVGAPDDVILSAGPAGIFLDQRVLARVEVSEDDVMEEMESLMGPDGRPVFRAAFPAIQVSFGRFC